MLKSRPRPVRGEGQRDELENPEEEVHQIVSLGGGGLRLFGGFRKSLLVRRNKGKSLLVRRQRVDLFVVISLDQEGLLGKLKECAQVIIVGERELQAIWENGNNGAVALA